MISAWQIYLVLQINSISVMLGVLSLVAAIGAFVYQVAVSEGRTANEPIHAKLSKMWAKVAVVSFVVAFLLPSTSTLATMLVLPAITSDKVVNVVAPEAKELYNLAKEAIGGLVHKEEPKK